MSPALLLPLGLAALVALAVPLVIHIARRSEQRPTDFAALRWLRQKPRPRQRLRFDEWPLLVARLVLLALLALWLARPVLFGSEDTSPRVAVVPGLSLDRDPVRAERSRSTGLPTGRDSWPVLRLRSGRTGEEVAIPPGAKIVWLAPGFPALNTPQPTAGPFPSLLRQLDTELPASAKLTVIVPATLQGADAERPRLSRAVDWRVVPGAMPLAPLAKAVLAMPAIRADPTHASALPYLRALASAWQQSATCPPSRLREGAGGWAPAINTRKEATGRPPPAPPASGRGGSSAASGLVDIGGCPATAALPAGAKTLIWLAAGPLPSDVTDWIAHGGTALVAVDTQVDRTAATAFWRDDTSAPLVEGRSLGNGRLLRFTRRLTPAEMPQLLSPEFPAAMAKLLAPPAPPPARVAARDYGPLTGGLSPTPPARELQPWLALLIGLVFLAERWLATSRRRSVAP